MGKWRPCKRRGFINKLKKIGFGSPELGGRQLYVQ